MRSITIAILALSLVVGTSQHCRATAIEPSDEVEKLIDPILEAALATRQHDSEATELELGRRFKKVLDDRSFVGDEALVVLLNFYVGEANGGDLLHQITLRGRRILPLLTKYQRANVLLKSNSHFDSLRLPPRMRKQNFTTSTDFISKGKVWGAD
jgi:hypothetical protein